MPAKRSNENRLSQIQQDSDEESKLRTQVTRTLRKQGKGLIASELDQEIEQESFEPVKRGPGRLIKIVSSITITPAHSQSPSSFQPQRATSSMSAWSEKSDPSQASS